MNPPSFRQPTHLITINDSFRSAKGDQWDIVYREVASFEDVRHLPMKSVGGISLYGDKMVLVYAAKRLSWEMPGGGIKKDESIEKGFERELCEEANMRVLQLWPLGYDTLTNKKNGTIIYQMRVAAEVEPIGDFVADPDGDITKIQLIDPREYTRFFNWGKRSDVMMGKALRLLRQLS